MAWEWRRGQRYYYRSKRTGSQVRKNYLGCGAQAIEADRIDRAKRNAAKQRAAREAQFEAELTQFDALLDRYDRVFDLVLRAVLRGRGFHKRRSEWRRKRDMHPILGELGSLLDVGQQLGLDPAQLESIKKPAWQEEPIPYPGKTFVEASQDELGEELAGEPTEFDHYKPRPNQTSKPKTEQERFEEAVTIVAGRLGAVPESMRELTARAELGDEEARQHLAESFESRPELWAELSDASRVIEHMLAKKLSASAEWRTEAIKVRARKMREAYAGTSSCPLVQLMAGRVVAIWLQLQLAELIVNADDTAITSTKSVTLLDRHDRRLSRAIKDLSAAHRAAGTEVDAQALKDVLGEDSQDANAAESSKGDGSRAEKEQAA